MKSENFGQVNFPKFNHEISINPSNQNPVSKD